MDTPTNDQQGIKKYIQQLLKSFKLQDSEAFYYSLVENIPQFIFCKDLEGRFTFVNQKFCNLLEKPIDSIIGKNDFDFFPPELAQKYRDDDRKVIESNKTIEDIEENKISHHETRYVHVIKTPIHDSEGNTIGIQGIFWDITKRKMAEEALTNANEKMKSDLVAASKVQRGFIPEEKPEIPGYHFSWIFEPSEYVGGDLLNVLRLDQKHWAFYILDVSGHGVPAALLSVSITRMVDQLSAIPNSTNGDPAKSLPEKIVRTLQRRFTGDNTKFCTMIYAILDTENGKLTWIRAGHEPPLFVWNGGKELSFLKDPGNLCICRLPDESSMLETGELFLEPGDRFVVYSDGIIEAMKNHEEFGYDRFSSYVGSTWHQTLDESIKAVFDQAALWAGSKRFRDDVTLLALERTPK